MSTRGSSPWMSVDQVAHELGMGVEWVRRQIIAGRLAARTFKTGPRSIYRIHRDQLEVFLAEFADESTKG